MPGDRGFAEIVNEPEVDDRRNTAPTAIVVYFLQPDVRSPLTPAPSSVSIRLDRGGKKTETVVMDPAPRPDDPAGGARYATKPGPYVLEAVRGKLLATIAGASIEQAFSGGR